jgi:hypothetical protein
MVSPIAPGFFSPNWRQRTNTAESNAICLARQAHSLACLLVASCNSNSLEAMLAGSLKDLYSLATRLVHGNVLCLNSTKEVWRNRTLAVEDEFA